jgi:hypothetical protein
MNYKWKPSKTAKREFAQNMQNPEFANDYYARKEAKADKRRSTSKFDYNSAGGNYIPTKAQHDFCFDHLYLFKEGSDFIASLSVMQGYLDQEKVHHDYIHIVNEKMRTK